MALPNIAFPGYQAFSRPDGAPNPTWIQFLLAVYNALGGSSGSASALLDTISNAPGSMLVRGSTIWDGLLAGPPFRVLIMGGAFPAWGLLNGNSFPEQPEHWFFGGPSGGGAAHPQFRALVDSDLPPLPPPDFGDQGPGTFFASPALVAGPPFFRQILPSDIPLLDASNFSPEAANAFLLGPASGADATPTFRTIATADLASAEGQFPGTATNDDATAGNVGEYASSTATNTSSVVTISNASPGVVTWAAHGQNIGSPVNFTTSGGLPTGLAPGVIYYVCSTDFLPGSFTVAASLTDAFAGTPIDTSSAGSGVHTAHGNAFLTTTQAIDITGLSLAAGDWDVWANLATDAAITTAKGWISLVSATDPSPPNQGAYASWGAQTLATPIGMMRVKVPAGPNQTVYLSMLPTFAGSVNGLGFLGARRPR